MGSKYGLTHGLVHIALLLDKPIFVLAWGVIYAFNIYAKSCVLGEISTKYTNFFKDSIKWTCTLFKIMISFSALKRNFLY